MPPSMKIKNPEDLTRAFKQLDKLTQTRYLETAVTSGMLPIENRVLETAPRKSSNYVRSIHHEIAISRPMYCEGVIGTNMPYAMRLEFGYKDTDSLGRAYDQPAQPHWRPAYDEKKQEAKEEIGASLNDILMTLIR